MIRPSKLAWCGIVVGALALGSSFAYAQHSGVTVDPALAKRGKTVYTNRGCEGCHTIGKGRRAGPDLAGVTERRSEDWLKKWLKDPTAMMDSDSTAKQLVADAHGVKMPNLKLSDSDVDALISYLAEAGKK
jgi:cbb3-type cytochrome oxidase cytochrome c subunit